MIEQVPIGSSYDVQFAWQMPDGDYIRAVFQAEVLDIIEAAQKYLVRLVAFRAGRQESADGRIMRSQAERSVEYWPLVLDLVGQRVTLAWETADGRALHMRLMTLTGEHDFFRRYNMSDEELNQLALEKLAIRFEKLQSSGTPGFEQLD